MVSSILLLFSDPDGFFRRDPKEWSGLWIPAIIVMVMGILSAIIVYIQTPIMLQILPEDLRGEMGILSLLGIPTGFIGPFIAWVVITGIFYVISLVFMGKGTFTRALAAVGYGFLPLAIGNLISLVLFWYFLPGMQVNPVKDIMDIRQASLALTNAPVFQMSTILSIIFLAWSASIWIFALRYSRELTLKNAAITVGIPVLIYIVFIIVFRVIFT